VSDEQLLSAPPGSTPRNTDIPVLIKADETSQLKKLAFVMDACRSVGPEQVQPPVPLAMKIVITGVTRGLGRALAEWYIAHGHTVAGCGRSGPAIFDLRFTHPEPHSFDAVDVTLPVKVSLWAERVLGALGRPTSSSTTPGS
jgi:hypothetical protein